MTNAYFDSEHALAGGDYYQVAAEGHAESEIVCAGITAILETLAGSVIQMASVTVTQIRMESGDVFISFRGGAEARTLFDSTLIGLGQIAVSYPGNINIFENSKKIAFYGA